MVFCEFLKTTTLPPPLFTDSSRVAKLSCANMCSFPPRTFYLRVPECDIQCIHVPKIRNLRAEPLAITDSRRRLNYNCRPKTKTCRGCTHIYNVQYILTYEFTLHPWPRIMDSAGKEKGKSNGPGARAATAGPCCSCQRDSLAACKHVVTLN